MIQTYKQLKKVEKSLPNNNIREVENLDVFAESQKISDNWFARTIENDPRRNENKDTNNKQ